MPSTAYIPYVEWAIEITDEFIAWWTGLDEHEQESVAASIDLLEQYGPSLPHPHSSGINGSSIRECENSGFSTKVGRFVCFMPLIPAARASYSLLATRQATDDSTKGWFLSPTSSTTII